MKKFQPLEVFARILPIVGTILLTQAAAAEPQADLRQAVLQAPAVQAARARWQAAQQRQPAAGRLPDPQVEGMYSEKRTAAEDIPMWEVTLQQPLPRAGERAADRARAAAQAQMAEADFAMAAGETAAEAAMQLAELATTRERIALLETQHARTELARAALDARIAAGQGRSAERLALEARANDLRLMIAQDQLMASNTATAVRARLGLAADAPLPAFAAPLTSDIEVEQSPAGHAAAARGREADAMATMARASGRPMTAVGVRFEREQMDEGDEDTVGIAFMTDLPWRSRRAGRADVVAARSEAEASAAEAERARRSAQAALEACKRAAELAALAAELGGQTGRQLDAECDALVRAAGTGGMGAGSPVLMLLELLERQTDVRMKTIAADGALRVARAQLWAHVPPRLLTSPVETLRATSLPDHEPEK